VTAAATVAATIAADYKDKIAALTLTITGMKEKTLYFSCSDRILALFLSFFPFSFSSFFSITILFFFYLSCLVSQQLCSVAEQCYAATT
jgi:hypothetical protein